MYGWIETGGYFDKTVEQDVVFRTTESNRFIALGNTTPSIDPPVAALYVQSNQVGVKMAPSGSNALSVYGDALYRDSSIYVENSQTYLRFDGGRLQFFDGMISNGQSKRSVFVDSFDSRVRADTMVTRNILTKRRIVVGVLVQSIENAEVRDNDEDPPVAGFNITIDSSFKEDFNEKDVFIVKDRTYYILRITEEENGGLTLSIAFYSPHVPLGLINFDAGDVVDIEILQDWIPEMLMKKEKVLYRMTVDAFQFHDISAGSETVTNGELELRVFLTNRTQQINEPFDVGMYFSLSSTQASATVPQNLLRLTQIDTSYIASNGRAGYIMRLQNGGNLADLVSLGVQGYVQSTSVGVKRSVYVAPMITIVGPAVNEEVVVGYIIDTISGRLSYQLVNSQLSGMLATGGIDSGLDTILLGARDPKLVSKAYTISDGSVVVDAFGGVSDEIFTVARQSVRYTYKGIPFRIDGIERITPDIVTVELTMLYEDSIPNIRSFEKHFMLWLDDNGRESALLKCLQASTNMDSGKHTISLSYANVANQSDLFDQSIFSELGRTVYIIPIKYTDHVYVDDYGRNVYLPYSLSVGTHKARETLTVNGNASVLHKFNMYNGKGYQNAADRFAMSFNGAGVFNMNNKMLVSLSNVTMNAPVEVKGNVNAIDYLKYSDRRIKSNIESTSEEDDMDKLMHVNVKTFNVRGSDKRSKGVIAQELEGVYPEAITRKSGVIACDAIGYVDYELSNYHIRIDRSDIASIESQIRIGCILRLSRARVDSCFDILVQGMHYTRDTFYLQVQEDENLRSGGEVRIHGIVDDLLLVNYEVLYISAVNAIKCLRRELDDVKRFLHM